MMTASKRGQWLMAVVLLLAFAIRTWRLSEMPPGWRDDELINSLVISQKVLDGQLAVYYADASGHEALYHVLNAAMLRLFGANALGIRLLSVFLGMVTVALTYRVGKRVVQPTTGVLAAAALAVSFWSLMYSRIGLRHILTPPLMLAAIWFFWGGWFLNTVSTQKAIGRTGLGHAFINTHGTAGRFLMSGGFMALGIYTYFASRGVPLIILAQVVYGAIFMWPRFKQRWPGIGLMFGITAVLALPLLHTIQNQPESEARVAELAVPLVAAREGEYDPLRHHVATTLAMFHADGDDEWLYNIPHRPVFKGVTAVLFWVGVLISVWYALQPLRFRLSGKTMTAAQERRAFAGALLFIWWLAGISPGFISVPPASLGHTILAQPAVFILFALPLSVIHEQVKAKRQFSMMKWQTVIGLLMLSLIILIGYRDWPAYFVTWPQRGLVRFLYRADIRDVAEMVNETGMTDFGVTGLLAGPWDKVALAIDLTGNARPRWYDPQRAVLLSPDVSFSGFPDVPVAYGDAFSPLVGAPRAGYYGLTQTAVSFEPLDNPICFENGLCAIYAAFDSETNRLTLAWEVARALILPPNPLISNPPPPGVYSGPRLAVFAQLLDEAGLFLSGDDGLWVDPYTLQVGDQFMQQHWLFPPNRVIAKAALFGLYDPKTGARILTVQGEDQVRIELE